MLVRSPGLLDENQLNIARTRQSPVKSIKRNTRQHTPKRTSHILRSAASVPVLRSPSARRALRPRGSRLDLLDNKNLTSFPSPINDNRINEYLDIIDDYIPVRKPSTGTLNVETLRAPHGHTAKAAQTTWTQSLWKKLRWRWRLQGLVH